MALPLLAQAVISLAVPKVIGAIGKKNNWAPTFTSLLSLGAGFGVGAAGAGAFSTGGAAAGSLAPVAGDVFKSGVGAGGVGLGGSSVAAVPNGFTMGRDAASIFGRGSLGSTPMNASEFMGLGSTPMNASEFMGLSVPPDAGAAMSTPQIAHSVYNPKGWATDGYNPAAGVGNYTSTWDKLKAYGNTQDGQTFLKSAAGTLVDGLFAERQPVRSSSGGGGGGGGGPRAPAYPGGGGAGQKQVVWGFGQGGFNPQQVA